MYKHSRKPTSEQLLVRAHSPHADLLVDDVHPSQTEWKHTQRSHRTYTQSSSILIKFPCCLINDTPDFMVFPHDCCSLFWVSTVYALMSTKWGLIHRWMQFPINELFSPVWLSWIMELLKALLESCLSFKFWLLFLRHVDTSALYKTSSPLFWIYINAL